MYETNVQLMNATQIVETLSSEAKISGHISVLKHDKSHDVSNYRVRTSPGTCKACGLCVERCPVEALRLEDSPEAANKKGKAAVLDPELCLGCGVCVYKCPTKSLILERREEITHPPKDAREWMERWFEDKEAASNANK